MFRLNVVETSTTNISCNFVQLVYKATLYIRVAIAVDVSKSCKDAASACTAGEQQS